MNITEQLPLQRSQPTFGVDEAAKLCDLSSSGLRNWIKFGVIRPALRGRPGRNRTHRFSPQQIYALATIGVLMFSERGCSKEYARKVIEGFESIDDASLEEWYGGVIDDHTEEAAAQWLSKPEVKATFLTNQGCPRLPCDDACEAKIKRLWEGIDKAIQVRKGLRRPERVSEER
jgi:DNA-binding transcriptional MerR regulator